MYMCECKCAKNYKWVPWCATANTVFTGANVASVRAFTLKRQIVISLLHQSIEEFLFFCTVFFFILLYTF